MVAMLAYALLIFAASASLASSCDLLEPPPTSAEIETAATLALAEFPPTALPQSGDFGETLRRTAELLGCDIEAATPIFSDGFESGDTLAWSVTVPYTSAKNGGILQEEYIPWVRYCGFGNTVTLPLEIHPHVSAGMNNACFEHDKCYQRGCVAGNCNFFGGSGSHSLLCDQPFFDYCDNEVPSVNLIDRIVCAVARQITIIWDFNREDCDAPPCDNGEVCLWDGQEGSCGNGLACVTCAGSTTCTVPTVLSYQCSVGSVGPCPRLDSNTPGQVVACQEACTSGICSLCAGPPRCDQFEGTAAQTGGPQDLNLSASATCGSPLEGGFFIDDGVFVLVQSSFLNGVISGNFATFELCNELGAPCFGVPSGEGTGNRGLSSFAGEFTSLGFHYTFQGTCAPARDGSSYPTTPIGDGGRTGTAEQELAADGAVRRR